MEDEQRDRLARRTRKIRKGRPSTRGILEREESFPERTDRDGKYTNRRIRRETLDEPDPDYEE